MKERKTAGPDGISNEAWKNRGEMMVGLLIRVLNKIWRVGLVKPVYKKGSKKLAKYYRPVTLMDTGYKLYAEILRRRIERQLES